MPEPIQLTAPETSRRFMEFTWASKEELWMNNFAENLPTIRGGKGISDIPRGKGPAIIIGGGPSAYPNLEKLAKVQSKYHGAIFVCDKMCRQALDYGLNPDFVVSIDGDPIIAKFYEHKKFCDLSPVKAILNVVVHPSVITTSAGLEHYWFVAILDNPTQGGPNFTRAFHYMTGKKSILDGMGNVGGTMWNLANWLGYDPICLIGLDFAYAVPESMLEKTIYYDKFLSMCAGDKAKVEAFYRKHTNAFDHTVITDVILLFYRDILAAYIKRAKTTTIQCSEYTILDDGVLLMKFEEFLEKWTK